MRILIIPPRVLLIEMKTQQPTQQAFCYDYSLMPSYARDDDSDYPFWFADDNIDELLARAEERLKEIARKKRVAKRSRRRALRKKQRIEKKISPNDDSKKA